MAGSAYYNENDPYCAEWLRNLIAAGHIAPGEVDERSIEDVLPADLHGFTQCHFFAGIGVWSYALRQAGWPDDQPVWTGSCPCQPFSAAGKRGGAADERHLWPAWFHLIDQCRPPVVFGEQVASKDGRAWFDLVQADLEGVDYASAAFDLCAAGFGAPHIRQRLYFVAYGGLADSSHERRAGEHSLLRAENGRRQPAQTISEVTGHGAVSTPGPANGIWRGADWLYCRDEKWRPAESGTFPLAHGAPARVGRLRAYGNAIVAPQAEAFIEAYINGR